MKNIPHLNEDDFRLFQPFLLEQTGLYFTQDRSQSLRIGLWERVEQRGYTSYREYYNFLKFHPQGRQELEQLMPLITIGETYFFRNSPHFDTLMNMVIPEIITKKTQRMNRSIRVWSAGCSRGDEPYSIAIAFMETLPYYQDWDISILATDINRKILSLARQAVYGKKDIGHMPGDYLHKYFTGTNSGAFTLKDEVKKMVRFDYCNLSRDPFIGEGMQNLDIIFCRNVIIYFDLGTTRRVIDGFYNCLNDDGYLFLGHAETLWQISDKFKAMDFSRTFVYKRLLHSQEKEEKDIKPFVAVPEIKLEDIAPIRQGILCSATPDAGKEEVVFPKRPDSEELLASSDSSRKLSAPHPGDIDKLYKQGAGLFKEKRYNEALDVFNKIISADSNNIRAYFARATILANQAKYGRAVDTLKKIIETDNLYLEAYYLLGVLAYKTADIKNAEDLFRKVIYIDPNVVLAYFNLGNIYLYQRKFRRAIREFNNALDLLARRPMEETIRFCEDFTVDFLLRACRNNLTKIRKTLAL
ncbi:MAG: CheR family methyltransferase [Candidatus Omnitrophota bacterium]